MRSWGYLDDFMDEVKQLIYMMRARLDTLHASARRKTIRTNDLSERANELASKAEKLACGDVDAFVRAIANAMTKMTKTSELPPWLDLVAIGWHRILSDLKELLRYSAELLMDSADERALEDAVAGVEAYYEWLDRAINEVASMSD